MQYYYYQKEGGTEVWKPIPETKLDTIEGSMFRTILSVDVPVSDDATKEQLASIKYKGPLYFDLDDAASPASTAQHAVALVKKLEDHGVFPSMLEIYASGGKGFHILVPEECFLTKPPKQGLPNLPAIFKEMAFQLAVPSMDYRVYTARKGRMFRCHNVLRPNGMYKVHLSVAELEAVAELDKEEAEAHYKTLCAAPRKTLDVPSDAPDLATGLLALFDQCKAKVSKVAAKTKKRKPTKLPENLPSFEAMLKGEGVKGDVGFHPIAMQIAITAHAKGMSREALLEAAEGLCNNHESDGHRYNTPAKRREELGRMWDYTEDNPCYEYSSAAISSLLTHSAPDLKGLDVTDEEVQAGIDNPDEGVVVEDEYEHAGVVMTKRGAFMLTEHGPKQLTAMSFENASELVSTENNQVSVVQADVLIAGNKVGTKVFELDTFNSVSNLNKMTMRYGQSFSGNDVQARGMYMRLVEKARKAKNRMYAVNREGLDVVSIPFHEDPELQQPFMIWADAEGVTPEPKIKEKNVIFKFVGFPDDRGQFQSDLSTSPSLAALIKDEDQKKQMLEFCHNLLECQKPAYLGRLLGWMVACHYRMLFHKLYAKFPLLHVNGSAGQGKCLGFDTPVLMADGTVKVVQNVKVGDKLLSPLGGVNTVMSLARGREKLYLVKQNKADNYVVNASHILSLKHTARKSFTFADGTRISSKDEPGLVHVTAETYYKSGASKSIFYGWKPAQVEFEGGEPLQLDPYCFGAWLGDGISAQAMLGKPFCGMVQRWLDYATELDCAVTKGGEDNCPTWAVVSKSSENRNHLKDKLRAEGVLSNKHIPHKYKTASIQERLELLAGLIDSDGTVNNSGFRFDSVSEQLANDVAFVARSVGLRATVSKDTYYSKMVNGEHTMYHVYITGDVTKIPTMDKEPSQRVAKDNALITGIQLEDIGEGDYYGFTLDGDRLFMLGDFTATHNTEMVKFLATLHYHQQEPKMLTPTSTLFAVQYAAAGSASIPLILDEFKPSEMNIQAYDRFKLMMRDAYNCRSVERGGGTRENSDYRAVHTTQLSAPICFIAEAAESESALMERVVLLTLIKPAGIQLTKYKDRFDAAVSSKHFLSSIGQYLAAGIVRKYSLEMLNEEFSPLLARARKRLMLTGEEENLSAEDMARRAGAKDRTVFNYAVAEFGLSKFQNLLTSIFGDEFSKVFAEMREGLYDSVDELQAQTLPEWLKVFNCFADMSRSDEMATYYLAEGKDYAFVNYDGRSCIELYARACYFKYRAYCSTARSKPLFPSEAAFVHALSGLTALVAKGAHVDLDCPGGSHVFDLDLLRSAGFLTPGK